MCQRRGVKAFEILLMAGGFLLLWVCWKMWRELQEQRTHVKNNAGRQAANRWLECQLKNNP